MRASSLLALSLLFPLAILAQKPAGKDGYELKFQIKGLQPGKAVLAYYYGNKQYIKDSARVDVEGRFSFKGDTRLDRGIYLAVMPPDNKYFEVVVADEQHITMTSETGDALIDQMKVTGSRENQLFYDYMRYIGDMKKQSDPHRKVLDQFHADSANDHSAEPAYKAAEAELNRIDKEVKEYKNNFISKNPTAFMAKVFKASREPEVPEAPLLPDGKKDSTFAYRWYKQHYWDDIDLTDDGILRTPVFHQKLETFFTKVVIQIPDSINAEVDRFVPKVKGNKDLFKYTVYWVTSSFETSKQMGMEAVFVHMAKTYYMTGQAFWVDSTTLGKISDRALKLDPILIGKVAPNLVMRDTLGQYRFMHGVKADYTFLCFWDPGCGHCKKVVPVLKEVNDKIKKEFNTEVYGVCTVNEVDEWKKFIREKGLNWINVHDPQYQTRFKDLYDIYSTPVIYILDKDKRIIAKRIAPEDIEDFIRRYARNPMKFNSK
jgi:thiol-disulfide isomerase/thioredoxin